MKHRKSNVVFLSLILFITVCTSQAAKREKYWVEIIMERGEVPIADPKYVNATEMKIAKINRASDYRMSMNITVLKAFDKNISVTIKTYHKWSNVYKEDVLTMKFNFCDFVRSWVYGIILKHSNFPSKCPVVGAFEIKNLSLDYDFHLFYNFLQPVTHARWDISFYIKKNTVPFFLIRPYFKVVTHLGTKDKKKINYAKTQNT